MSKIESAGVISRLEAAGVMSRIEVAGVMSRIKSAGVIGVGGGVIGRLSGNYLCLVIISDAHRQNSVQLVRRFLFETITRATSYSWIKAHEPPI